MMLLSRFLVWAVSIFEGGRQSDQPRSISPVYAQDFKKNRTLQSWKQKMASGNYLYANLPQVKLGINQKASYVAGAAWIPQFAGRDKRWGDKAEAWLWEWMKICDVRGGPYDFRTNLFLTSIALDRDSDDLMVLTRSKSGYPQVQFLPAYRVQGRHQTLRILEEGPYRGLREFLGVVLDRNNRAIGFRVLGETPEADVWISASDGQLNFSPHWFDQGRGILFLACGLNDWQDVRDIRDFDKLWSI